MSPRACSICTHGSRAEIDKALVAGEPVTRLSALFRVSADSLDRHRANHLPATLVKAREAQDVRHALDVVQQLKAINAASLRILADARAEGDGALALKAVDRIQRQIELQAKLLGELDERPVLNVVLAPEWPRLVAGLRAVLSPHPAILAQVSAHLLSLEAEGAARAG